MDSLTQTVYQSGLLPYFDSSASPPEALLHFLIVKPIRRSYIVYRLVRRSIARPSAAESVRLIGSRKHRVLLVILVLATTRAMVVRPPAVHHQRPSDYQPAR
jgi:hypothetical protein